MVFRQKVESAVLGSRPKEEQEKIKQEKESEQRKKQRQDIKRKKVTCVHIVC